MRKGEGRGCIFIYTYGNLSWYDDDGTYYPVGGASLGRAVGIGLDWRIVAFILVYIDESAFVVEVLYCIYTLELVIRGFHFSF